MVTVWGSHGERETEVRGRAPQRGPGAEPLVMVSVGFAPEAESFFAFAQP